MLVWCMYIYVCETSSYGYSLTGGVVLQSFNFPMMYVPSGISEGEPPPPLPSRLRRLPISLGLVLVDALHLDHAEPDVFMAKLQV